MSSIKFFVSFLKLLASITVSIAYPYDGHKYLDRVEPYPLTCCHLEWTDINPGDKLPKDYVKAGTFLNRDWAYVGMKNGFLGAKSDQSSEEPNWIGFPEYKVNPYPILTNPNKCYIGWYTTRFNNEELPWNPDWHFPRVMFFHTNGDFARYQGTPSWSDRFGVRTISSLTERTISKAEHYDLLYVDCKKSILSMSRAKLFNISYDKQAFEDLKTVPNRVVYTKKIMVNNSPEKSKSEIKFQIETFDNASLQLSKSHFNHFKTDEQTYREFSAGVKFNFLFKFLGIGANGGHKNEKWTNTDSGNSNYGELEIYRTTARRELFEFSQKVTIPPYSKTTLVAFSKPIKGNIPFTAIYELFPTGSKESNTARVLEDTLRHYDMDQKMEKTSRGTLLVHYEGTMHVDAGHEVDVDIQSVKLGTAPPEVFY